MCPTRPTKLWPLPETSLASKLKSCLRSVVSRMTCECKAPPSELSWRSCRLFSRLWQQTLIELRRLRAMVESRDTTSTTRPTLPRASSLLLRGTPEPQHCLTCWTRLGYPMDRRRAQAETPSGSATIS
eukprot:Rmarinus@m.29195